MEAGRERGSEEVAAGVRAAPDADPALALGPGLALVRSELSWRFSRASGPGGQNVNKTDSRVELRFPLATTAALPAVLRARALGRLASRLVEGELVVAEEHRSQWRNRQAALERLRELLRQAIAPPPPPRRATRPSRGSVERRLVAKRQRAGRKAQRRGGIRPEED